MSTNTTEVQSEKAGAATPGKSEVYAHLEELLKEASQAPTIPLRMAGVAKAIAVVFKWNQAGGGKAQTWDLESDQEYKQWVVNYLLEATAQALGSFAEVSGVAVGGEEVLAKPPRAGKEKPAEPDEQAVWTAALESQAVIGRKGRRLRGGGTVAGNHRAIEFISLLRRLGGLTRDQLRFLADFPKSQGVAAQHETSETINLLVSAKFVTPQDCDTWKNSQAELYTLSPSGQAFYNLLHRRELGAAVGAYGFNGSLQHLYGVNQVLASIGGACKVATSTGQLKHLLVQALGNPAWYAGPDEQAGLALDWENNNQALAYRDNGRFVYPDAMGRLLVDDPQVTRLLLTQANLSPDKAEVKFNFNRFEGNAVWPFILEYDSAEDSIEYITQKVVAYTEIFNIRRFWSEKWQGRFPVILVVTAGDSKHLLNLMLAVRDQLKRVLRPKLPQEWWFTNVNWFTTAYSDFIGTFNNRRKQRALPATPVEDALLLAERGRIWLPLAELGSGPEPRENVKIVLNSLNFLMLNEDVAARRTVVQGLVEAGLDDWIEKLVALPIPHGAL